MMTEPGDLVVDFFAGSNTSGRAAEDLGRRWLSFKLDPDYAAQSVVRCWAIRSRGSSGAYWNNSQTAWHWRSS